MDLAFMTLWEAGYFLPPANPPKPEKTVLKGHCQHCGKKVGKGLFRHEKACAKVKR